MEQLYVQTKSKTYPIFFANELAQLSDFISQLIPAPTTLFIISEATVGSLYLESIIQSLKFERICVHLIPSGEESKSLEQFYQCHTALLEAGLDRNSIVIALGGGVIGDLAGFVAATFMRGIRFIQVPTTLLAHDSAVGGKVAINHPQGKNMIGTFYQPDAVYYYLPFLKTLPEIEWRSGLAEIIKHAYISDERFVNWLELHIYSFADLSDETLKYAIETSIQVKAQIVAEDEREKGARAILNFGHTLGHALEKELGYGKITHGDAVAIGMEFSMLVSEKIYGKKSYYKRLNKLLSRFQFPIINNIKIENVILHMKKDKKAYNGHIHMVLMREIGDMEVMKVSEKLIKEVLVSFMETKKELEV
jgi:3-dehydroquinate synthase